jgi:hypothetical protein
MRFIALPTPVAMLSEGQGECCSLLKLTRIRLIHRQGIMAEAVRKVLEDQVAELEDLRRRRIFTAEEIRSVSRLPSLHRQSTLTDCRKIVRKRKAFEYALHRRTPLKRDFLQYIDVSSLWTMFTFSR